MRICIGRYSIVFGFSVASFRAYKKSKTKLQLLELIGSLMVVFGATVVFIAELMQ
jgi:hypothetical protein